MLSLKKIKNRKKQKKKTNTVFALNFCPQKKGIVRKIRIVSPKKPNSAKRSIAKVELTNKRWVLARIKGSGHNLQPFSNVLVTGGRANDLPGVRYTLIRGVKDFAWQEKFLRVKKRSKYGTPKEAY